MAVINYPELPKYFGTPDSDLSRFYGEIEQWASEMKYLLEIRDTAIDSEPSTRIRTVVTVGTIGRLENGDLVYAASASKYRGYVSGTGWVDFN